MRGRVLHKVATEDCFQSKKNLKFKKFWGYVSKAKMVPCNEKNVSIFDKLERSYIVQLPIFWK